MKLYLVDGGAIFSMFKPEVCDVFAAIVDCVTKW